MITIDKKLLDNIESYCTINGINKNLYTTKLLKEAFNKDRYGDRPKINVKQQEKVSISKESEHKFETINVLGNSIDQKTEIEEKTIEPDKFSEEMDKALLNVFVDMQNSKQEKKQEEPKKTKRKLK